MQRAQVNSRVHRLTLALAGMAFALTVPLYLTLTHLPWPVEPTELLPALMVACTACGLVAVWVRSRVAHGRFRLMGDTGIALLFCCGVPALLALATGYLSLMEWGGLYPANTNYLASFLMMMFAALICGMSPLLLFEGTRTTLLVLVYNGVIACVLLSIPGTPLQSWSLLPTQLMPPSALIFDLLGIVLMVTLVVSWLRGQLLHWERRHVKVFDDAPAIASMGAWAVSVAVITALLVPIVLPRSSDLENFWQQHDPLVGRVPFTSVSHTGGTPFLMPGDTIGLGTPDITSNAVVLTWQLQQFTDSSGTGAATITVNEAPPLVLATYDQFTSAASIWSQSATTAGEVGATLSTATDASTLIATITPEHAGQTTTLAAFDTSIHIVGGVPRLLVTRNSSTLALASWQSIRPVKRGGSYIDTASVPSLADMRAATATTANLPANELARLLAVPTTLAPTLQTVVQTWTTPGMTPLQKAEALAKGMRQKYTLVTQEEGSTVDGMALLANLLTNHRGNALTWATLHVLLCRAAGLPARLASGFTPGTSDVKTGVSTVRARDATWLTQIATTAGWLHIGPLDHAVTVPIPQNGNGNTEGNGAPPAGSVPTLPVVGQKVSQPTGHPAPRSRNSVLTPLGLSLVLVGLFVALSLVWVVWRWWKRFSREHGPLEQELRWLLQSLLRSARRVLFGAGSVTADRAVMGVSMTPRQAGDVLASRLPGPLAGLVLGLADRYCRLVYARTLPQPAEEPRQQYRLAANQARRILKRHTPSPPERDLPA